jgi:acetate kinase
LRPTSNASPIIKTLAWRTGKSSASAARHYYIDRRRQNFASLRRPVRDTKSAVETVVRWIASETSGIDEIKSLADIHAVGHRVVHGGERFTQSVLITEEVLRGIEDCIELAPLHNPANIKGILAAREIFGAGLPQAAVFDTAFHQTLPEKAYSTRCRISFTAATKFAATVFTARRIATSPIATAILNLPREQVNVITLHLGNGCSIAAIRAGNSIDTSMG